MTTGGSYWKGLRVNTDNERLEYVSHSLTDKIIIVVYKGVYENKRVRD